MNRLLHQMLPLVLGLCLTGTLEAQEEKKAAEQPAVGTAKASTKKAPGRVSVRHVVISYQGAERGLPGVTRTKDEAKKLIDSALVKANAEGADFEKIVVEFSDDPNKAVNKGRLGILQKGRLHPSFKDFETAVFALDIGQVSKPLETPMGFHIVQRVEIVEFAASHILIQFKGSERADPSVTRTKEEAKKLAEDIATKAKAAGADFADLAKKHSDGPSGPRGGSLGIFMAGQMVPPFEAALAKLAIGGVSGVVETGFGYHVIRRNKIERIGASHILIQYKGSLRAKPEVSRTKEEAKKFAETLQKQANRENFAELAKKNSDGPSGPDGGSLGTFERGAMVPAFETVAFALNVGVVSKVVETDFGFHVILRTE